MMSQYKPTTKVVRQKPRRFTPDHQDIIKEEVGKLLQPSFICKVHYPKWLANMVLIRKNNGKWEMCIDYINLNKACLKDNFPLPQIDHMLTLPLDISH